MNSLSPWVRKLAAVGLLVGMLALLWSTVLAPLRRWSVMSIETLNDARFELTRISRAVEVSKHISAERLAGIEQSIASYVVPAGNEAEAITHVQALVNQLLKEQRVTLESIQAGNLQPAGALTRITIDLRANGAEPKIIGFLAALEQATPILRIDRLALRGLPPGAPDKTTHADARVALEATISAYWRSHQGRGEP